MTGPLPHRVAWRNEYDHLGPEFMRAALDLLRPIVVDTLARGRDLVAPFVRPEAIDEALARWTAGDVGLGQQVVWPAFSLATALATVKTRQVARTAERGILRA
jgi:hypothetical protein